MTNLILLTPKSHDIQTYESIELYRDINQRLKKLKKDEDEIKAQLADGYFANHQEFIYDGRLLLVYSDRKRADIDRDKLKMKYPDAFMDCQKVVTYKQFDLK